MAQKKKKRRTPAHKPRRLSGGAKEKIAGPLRKFAVSMDNIAPDPTNARIHSQKNLDAIRGSLLAFGQQKPIVVDEEGLIVAGNGLYTAARALGWKRIAAVKTRLRGSGRLGYAIADNRTGELAAWDEGILALQLEDLQAADFDFESAGFSEDELVGLLTPGGAEGLTDPDAVPEPPADAITKPGDLWVLGEHRLLCGDSRKAEDVAQLMGVDVAVRRWEEFTGKKAERQGAAKAKRRPGRKRPGVQKQKASAN